MLPGQARLTPEDCYAPIDLRIGASVSILGRTFLIYDCDAATRAWYMVGGWGGGLSGGWPVGACSTGMCGLLWLAAAPVGPEGPAHRFMAHPNPACNE